MRWGGVKFAAAVGTGVRVGGVGVDEGSVL